MAEKMSKEELRRKVETLVLEYNEHAQNAEFSDKKEINKEIEKSVNEYTSMARTECFNNLIESGNPMLEAVKELVFDTIRVRDTVQGDDEIPVRVVEEIQRPIDLIKLHKYVDGGIGANKDWNYEVEKFNMLMTAQKCQDLGINPKVVNNSYAMSDIAKKIDMGKTPTSKTNMLKTLNRVVQSMIGEEYKATSHDVNYLLSIYSKKKRQALTVTCANHKYMRQYLAEICHRIVLGKAYEVDFKKKRA